MDVIFCSDTVMHMTLARIFVCLFVCLFACFIDGEAFMCFCVFVSKSLQYHFSQRSALPYRVFMHSFYTSTTVSVRGTHRTDRLNSCVEEEKETLKDRINNSCTCANTCAHKFVVTAYRVDF